MTAFSDFPAAADHPLHPRAEQIRAYLEEYALAFGVTDRIRDAGHARVVPSGEPLS